MFMTCLEMRFNGTLNGRPLNYSSQPVTEVCTMRSGPPDSQPLFARGFTTMWLHYDHYMVRTLVHNVHNMSGSLGVAFQRYTEREAAELQ